jgi:hypothetical protein
MMDDKPKVNDVVDTTDCLEAIGAFKAMKNLFFMVVFICLIVLQGIFWLNYLGYIDASETSVEPAAAVVDVEIVDVTSETEPAKVETGALIAADAGETANDVTIKERAEKVVADVTGGEKDTESEAASVEDAALAEDTSEEASASALAKYMPKSQHAEIAIRICNFVLAISATIYCLILLMSLKISLIGRLGGISHISRAFFLSLIALVILLPWQCLFEGVVLGAIYLPAELFTKWVLTDESTLICKIMYFARFSGMWAISLLFLLAAQVRSAKWSKTTLRRLGILR